MKKFRHLILSIADGLAVFSLIAVTLGAALLGGEMGAVLGRFDGASDRATFGFFIGGASGFVAAAVVSSFLFTLKEIAANTRWTREALGRLVEVTMPGGTVPDDPAASPKPNPVVIKPATPEERDAQ